MISTSYIEKILLQFSNFKYYLIVYSLDFPTIQKDTNLFKNTNYTTGIVSFFLSNFNKYFYFCTKQIFNKNYYFKVFIMGLIFKCGLYFESVNYKFKKYIL